MSVKRLGEQRWDRKQLALTLVFFLLVTFFAAPLVHAQDEEPEEQPSQVHVVVPGESLYGIAARYGVSPGAIISVNDIGNPNYIRTGTRLVIPSREGQTGLVHSVKRGESLSSIATRYGVTTLDIIRANNLIDPNYVFSGQRLMIPVVEEGSEETPTLEDTVVVLEGTPQPGETPQSEETPVATFTPQLAATETPEAVPAPERASGAAFCPTGCESISISAPFPDEVVDSPLSVSGFSNGFQEDLVVRVLDQTGQEIGITNAAVRDTDSSFSAVINYVLPAETQLGRVQVYSLSSLDGAIEHLSSVVVILHGAGLEEQLSLLEKAVEEKDYEQIEELLMDEWVIGFYRSEGLVLRADEAIEQLKANYLGPGQVAVDLAVDGRELLADRIAFPDNVTAVVYSSGWGPDGVDDAFLLMIAADDGRSRWGGMLYVYDALRDYEF
ncbi:MAG: LysM peptidoglycan-binding domain-containing protein [Chloroflexota bacterium]|nr:LysM peptidoglycan-binding domain-containing protein [Chloroflexota bacterium]